MQGNGRRHSERYTPLGSRPHWRLSNSEEHFYERGVKQGCCRIRQSITEARTPYSACRFYRTASCTRSRRLPCCGRLQVKCLQASHAGRGRHAELAGRGWTRPVLHPAAPSLALTGAAGCRPAGPPRCPSLGPLEREPNDARLPLGCWLRARPWHGQQDLLVLVAGEARRELSPAAGRGLQLQAARQPPRLVVVAHRAGQQAPCEPLGGICHPWLRIGGAVPSVTRH
mmetsp:Transcript_91172/g.283620  ORF Transcript_91172/g.283620 Transcript_91172/m.283620 type:complete len:227 (+) Transcript_91172:124-804(+)